ncbi:MAG: 16S rRNA processing protein RimM [Desulfobulbaceae bacterium]|nr:16S rRNA processing protein RimM [Desulfobulbaceae bacterium]
MTPLSSGPPEAYVMVGIVIRPHGIKGDLKVHPYTEEPGNFCRYRRLYLSADAEGAKVPYVNAQSRVNGNTVILRLEECTTRDRAEQLAGMKIWVAVVDLPPVGTDEFYLYTLEGKQAQTLTGLSLGTVTAILSNSGQDILIIKDAQNEYLVPLVRAFFVTIDDEKVVLDLPPGLLEINR